MLLRGGVRADGSRVDVAVDSGRIVALGIDMLQPPGTTVVDCHGMVVLPAPAEPHVHLDKVFSEPRSGDVDDLAGAVSAWEQVARRDAAETKRAASRAVETLVANGCTAIRSHVEISEATGLDAARALLDLRAELHDHGTVDLQLVAMASCPLTGRDGGGQRRRLHEALRLGFDVAGAAPWRDPDPAGAIRVVLDTARENGVPVDLHMDETLDPETLTLFDLLNEVEAEGLGAGVTASHCVSLGMQVPDVQRAVATELAARGVSVVTLPQTNLYLQARAVKRAKPRGITALDPLFAAGVTVAAGADNARDVFCPVGRLDPCETAVLLVLGGHLDAGDAWAACSAGARRAMGLPAVGLEVGSPADLLCIGGTSLVDAIAGASANRITIHRGEVVARTSVQREVWPSTSRFDESAAARPVPVSSAR